MYSEFLSLNLQDLSRGLVIAVLTAIFSSMVVILQSPDFSFTSFDYNEIIKTAMIAALAYMSKNLISDKTGKVLGKI